MELFRLTDAVFDALVPLYDACKETVGENAPTDNDLCALKDAIRTEHILFFGCCSVSVTFSTFFLPVRRLRGLLFLPAYRHRGAARMLVCYAYENCGVASMTVGCADCDLMMYKSLGFSIPIGNILMFDAD